MSLSKEVSSAASMHNFYMVYVHDIQDDHILSMQCKVFIFLNYSFLYMCSMHAASLRLPDEFPFKMYLTMTTLKANSNMEIKLCMCECVLK